MNIKLLTLTIACIVTGVIRSQELNCNIKINSDKIQGSNKSVFATLQKDMTEFMNTRRWTELEYFDNEKIECSMNIVINSVDGDSYSGEIVVQSRRPVFNSSYTTTLLNLRDVNFKFDYKEFDQLQFVNNNLTNNLTAVLAYYAYIIIGYDMDSFARLGGTSCFQQAESIVTQAQSSSWSGWKAFEDDKNRYALISNLTDEAFKKYREYFYEYHRLGLDEMAVNSTNGRARVVGGTGTLVSAYKARQSSHVITVFLDSKADEIINILKKGSTEEKKQVYDALVSINPARTSKYEQILKN